MAQLHNRVIASRRPFHLGDWLVEPMLDRMSRGEQVVQLRPRAMDVLACLALQGGELASKRHLIDTVWRTEFVSDHVLTQVIAELRAALGDNARNPSYIENIPRRGYRLVASLTPIESAGPAATGPSLPFRLEGEEGDYPLAQGTNLIGRTADAVVLIDRTEVSRCHARIVVEGTAATLEDLGSKNGTYLNGQRLRQPSPLTDGDEIWIGRSVARFRFVAEGEPTTTEHSMT
jgi:DNA-binding winged helix-turn-helix (wHTH) protein